MTGTEARQAAIDLLCEQAEEFSREGYLLRKVVARFLPLIHDLPATGGGHHSWKFGLLDHSLEVALTTLHDVSDEARRNVKVARLVAPALAAALLHDLGLVFEVIVTWQGRTWEPVLEDLATFARLGELVPPKQPFIRWRARYRRSCEIETTRLFTTLVPRIWRSPVLALMDRYKHLYRNVLARKLGLLDHLAGPIRVACVVSARMARIGNEPGSFLRHLLAPPGSVSTSPEEILAAAIPRPE